MATRSVKTVADQLRELADRGHGRGTELRTMADSYEQSLKNLMTPSIPWPDPAKSNAYEAVRAQALDLFYACGGELNNVRS